MHSKVDFFLLTFYTLKSISIVVKYKELWSSLCCGFVTKYLTQPKSIIPVGLGWYFWVGLLSGSKGSERFWDVCMNVISYAQLVIKENGKQIQKGMNFAIQKTYSVVLMSTQKNAPYNDQIFNDGVIEYEGHDVPANINPEKKLVDQSLLSP